MDFGSRVNVDRSSPSHVDELPAFPRLRWLLSFFGLWLLFGLVPAGLIYFGNHFIAFGTTQQAAAAGTIGDSFGLANSFFAGAALLFVIWSIRLQQQEIRFARDEWRENTQSQREQAERMREAAALTAVSHIYNHYSENYGANDASGVLGAVAAGHRRWAIRESFSSLDRVFDGERRTQVELESRDLANKLDSPPRVGETGQQYLREVAAKVASLLVDKRADERFRRALWPIYEAIRADPQMQGSRLRELLHLGQDAAQVWRQISTREPKPNPKVEEVDL